MNHIIRVASRLTTRPILDRVMVAKPLPNCSIIGKRWASNFPLTYDFARERIMLVLHLFDKIDPNKLKLESSFVHDLGLDSLDHTEIIMMLEDEFKFEIPDKDAEKLLTPADILKYITDKEEAYEELQHHHHHGHDHDHDAGHGSSTTQHDHNPITTQKREFSTLITVPRRYKLYNKGDVYSTTFNTDPLKEIKIEDIQERVMKVCSKYDKIDSSKLDLASHFVDDLGLDSLDHVEIMMELEDEFGLEIPDQEAEKLMRPAEIAAFIFRKEEARALKPEDRPM